MNLGRNEAMMIRKIIVNALFFLVLMMPTISTAQTEQPLRSNSNVDNTDPYCGTNGYLEEALGVSRQCSITNTSIPNNVSDWVLLELRAVDSSKGVEGATTETVVARKPALLLQNGYVVDADKYGGTDTCTNFNVADPDNCPLVEFDFPDNTQILGKDLYVVVRHINHLDIISNEKMSTATTSLGTSYTYDFTVLTASETNAARGGNLGLKIENGTAAMYVGDVNHDANINAADYLQIYNDAGTTSKRSDIDFNGTVNADDASSRLGQNLGRTTQLP